MRPNVGVYCTLDNPSHKSIRSSASQPILHPHYDQPMWPTQEHNMLQHHRNHQQHLQHQQQMSRNAPNLQQQRPPPLPDFQHNAQGLLMPMASTNKPPTGLTKNVNQQRINECAGIPLISNASAHLTAARHQRLPRKLPLAVGVVAPPPPPQAQACWANFMQAGHPPAMAHFTAHAQGVPLQLQHQQQYGNCHWNSNFAYSYPAQQQRFHSQSPRDCRSSYEKPTQPQRLLRYQNSAPAILSSAQSKENILQESLPNGGSSIQNSEAKDSPNESCLPRIIKPRKRRKKDRKPANGIFLKMNTDVEENLNVSENSSYNRHPTMPPAPVMQRPVCMSIRQQHAPAVLHSGICFCSDCDALRCIWDYPLKRSLSDSSATTRSTTHSSLYQVSSDMSSRASTSASSSACSLSGASPSPSSGGNITDCDYNLSKNYEKSRAADVGVIGSQRCQNEQQQQQLQVNDASPTTATKQHRHYSDILAGINIASDLFNRKTSSDKNNEATQSIAEYHGKFSTSSTVATAEVISAAKTEGDRQLDHYGDCLQLLPETAETLLTESINEISRKLIETCSNNETTTTTTKIPTATETTRSSITALPSSAASLSSFSTCSDFSNDSGIETNGSGSSNAINLSNELVFNFERLNLLALQQQQQQNVTTTSTKTTTTHNTNETNFLAASLTPTLDFLLMDLNNNNTDSNSHNDSSNHLNLNLKLNSNNGDKNNNKMGLSTKSGISEPDTPFYQFHDIANSKQQQQQQKFNQNNCFDLVWQHDANANINNNNNYDNYNRNCSNISFLHNIGEHLKSSYSIT